MDIENIFTKSYHERLPQPIIFYNQPFLVMTTGLIEHDNVPCYRFELVPLTNQGREIFHNMAYTRLYGYFSYDESLLAKTKNLNHVMSLIDYPTYFNSNTTQETLYTNAQHLHHELEFYRPFDANQFNDDVLNDLDNTNDLIDRAKEYKIQYLRKQLGII